MVEAIENRLGRGLHVAHLNCQSLVNKFDLLSAQLTLDGFDVLTLSETWLTDRHQTNHYKIPSYELFRGDRETKNNKGLTKKGGGVALYVSNKLIADDSKLMHLNRSNSNIEIKWILLKYSKQRDIAIASVYRPPNGDLDAFLEELEESIPEACKNNTRDIFVLGDMNVNMNTNIRKEENKSKMENLFKVLGLAQLIEGNTRLSNNSTLLDLIITNSKFVKIAGIRSWGASDHELVYVTRKKHKDNAKWVKLQGRSYKNYDGEVFSANMASKKWDIPGLSIAGVQEIWNTFKTNLEKTLDELYPIKQLKIREKHNPWFTKDITDSIALKRALGDKARKSNSEEDRKAYNRARNDTVAKVRNAKTRYIANQDEIHKSNSVKFWEVVKLAIPSNKEESGIKLTDHKGDPISDLEAAEKLNTHFAEIGPSLAQKFTEDWEYYGVIYEKNIEDCTANREQVLKLIQEIKTHKASGLANISATALKDAFSAVPDQIIHMFNASLSTGIFPDEWKEAVITPLHKGGDKSKLGNYRPISILPAPGKLLEKVMHAHIYNYLDKNNILTNRQGGFRPGHSTVTSIAELTNAILNATNDGETTVAAYVDFSKAFDTVNHDILLRKLTKIGITGKTHDWIANYLTNRMQRTKVNGMISEQRPVTCGVPQGSVMGPLLFLIYINDLVDFLQDTDIGLYADDTVIYASHKEEAEARLKLNNKLAKLDIWCNKNKISVNFDKSKVVVYGKKRIMGVSQQPQPPTTLIGDGTDDSHIATEITIGQNPLQQLDSYKYLGVILDDKLTYTKHIQSVIKKVSHKIWLFTKLRIYMTNNMAVKIYKAMILPYLDYGDVVYMGGNSALLEKIQRLQNRALKVALRLEKRYPTNLLHKQTKISLLSERRDVHLAVMAHRMTKDKKHLLVSTRDTRAGDAPLLKTKLVRKTAYSRSVEAMAAKKWNNLPVETRRTQSSQLLGDRLRRELVKKQKDT
jgi:hypothetical protein